MQSICRIFAYFAYICTPHFADGGSCQCGWRVTGRLVSARNGPLKLARGEACSGQCAAEDTSASRCFLKARSLSAAGPGVGRQAGPGLGQCLRLGAGGSVARVTVTVSPDSGLMPAKLTGWYTLPRPTLTLLRNTEKFTRTPTRPWELAVYYFEIADSLLSVPKGFCGT